MPLSEACAVTWNRPNDAAQKECRVEFTGSAAVWLTLTSSEPPWRQRHICLRWADVEEWLSQQSVMMSQQRRTRWQTLSLHCRFLELFRSSPGCDFTVRHFWNKSLMSPCHTWTCCLKWSKNSLMLFLEEFLRSLGEKNSCCLFVS